MKLTRTQRQGRKREGDKFASSGLSMEELQRLQEEQFKDAAARHM
jgi:hypothetical protein